MEKTNQIKGGKADGMSCEDIARKHNVFVGTIKKQLEMGLKVEKEHTPDEAKAKEIALDHLSEFPDYYTRLDKMEKNAKKSTETKEQTMADASGSFEGSAFGNTITKRKIQEMIKNAKQVSEQMDAGVSAGAMYDGPIGTAGPSSPMDKTKKKRKDPLAIDEKASDKGSITAASTKDMIATKKGFPRFGGPEAKFVEINPKCKKFPYCNQGASSDGGFKSIDNIKLTEAIQEASKKYGISEKEIRKMVMKEMEQTNEALPKSWFDDPGNERALRGWVDKGPKPEYKVTTNEPISMIMDDDVEIARLKLIFHNHNVKFDIVEIKK